MRVFSNGGNGIKGSASILDGAMFCSGCGLCETYSCPQGLSPRAIISEMKDAARKNGIKPPQGIEPDLNVKDAELRRVSVERLTARLGLQKYNVDAPLTYDFETKNVKILLSQHIGAPAVACVKEGDTVKMGDVIGKAQDGALSVNVHSSIDGKVTSVNEKYIRITRI
jgi:Na+-translocating ferredoxin:NAD+ oxidoreductase RnfC subunit